MTKLRRALLAALVAATPLSRGAAAFALGQDEQKPLAEKLFLDAAGRNAPALPTASAPAPAAVAAPAVPLDLSRVPGDGQVSAGRYIAPNEWRPYLFAPVLKGKTGALISVGTFRTLNDAVLGDFSEVVMFDYDQKTTGFNRANLDLIADSKDRFEYLLRLFNRPPEPSLLSNARAGRLTDRQFFEALLQLPLAENEGQTGDDRRAQKFIDAPEWRDLLEEQFKHISRGPQWDCSYWGSDQAFSALKEKILEGRVAAVCGDLTGRRSLAALARALRDGGVPVSALDLSNALDYFASNRKELASFLRNIQRIRFAPDGVVLYTEGGYYDINDVTRDHDLDFWFYAAVPAAAFPGIAPRTHDQVRQAPLQDRQKGLILVPAR